MSISQVDIVLQIWLCMYYYIGGKEGFRQTTAKIEGIINMSHPANITELRSFLGAYNQLRWLRTHSWGHAQTPQEGHTVCVGSDTPETIRENQGDYQKSTWLIAI